mmetsp:Transcript_2656/g.6788  ORF Transcript_2656/g.6788 Transcript_2656/m.6788 type:complete len:220 (-) Transcript_2656:363-1022(-)
MEEQTTTTKLLTQKNKPLARAATPCYSRSSSSSSSSSNESFHQSKPHIANRNRNNNRRLAAKGPRRTLMLPALLPALLGPAHPLQKQALTLPLQRCRAPYPARYCKDKRLGSKQERGCKRPHYLCLQKGSAELDLEAKDSKARNAVGPCSPEPPISLSSKESLSKFTTLDLLFPPFLPFPRSPHQHPTVHTACHLTSSSRSSSSAVSPGVSDSDWGSEA